MKAQCTGDTMGNRVKIVATEGNRYKFSGIIDEASQFNDLIASFGPEVWLDFSEVSRINSCGVRQWVTAIYSTNTRIHYLNVPSLIVDQFSMVPEFLGPNSMVENFEARFICDACGHEETQMLVVGKDVQACQDEYVDGPSKECPKCAAAMEFDHNPDVYLEFLKNVKK